MKNCVESFRSYFSWFWRTRLLYLIGAVVVSLFGGCAGSGKDVASGGRDEARVSKPPETEGDSIAEEKARDRTEDKGRSPSYKNDFAERTLRVDLVHKGSHDPSSESYEVDELVLEKGDWPGSRIVLVDPDDFGIHRFDIRDKVSKRLIFRQGFGSLFSEWQSTGEAKRRERSFSESVRFPRPKRPFILEIFTRRRDNTMRMVSSFVLDPERAREAADPGVGKVNPIRLHGKRPPHKALDVLIIADGYIIAEREKALSDGRRFTEVLLSIKAFAKQSDGINVWLLIPPSKSSGVSEPRKGIELDTPVGLSFNTLGSPRYMMTLKNKKLRAWAALAPYDQLYLMSNTSRYGGGGIYNLYSTFPADNEYSEYVYIHEFGHSFGGLGDEYYGSPVATTEFYPPGVEPWEPNLTRFLKGRYKWSDMVSQNTPVPTPPDPERFSGTVGLFEGAGYTGKGMYRPALDCKMFSKAYGPFCPVCSEMMKRRLTRYTQ